METSSKVKPVFPPRMTFFPHVFTDCRHHILKTKQRHPIEMSVHQNKFENFVLDLFQPIFLNYAATKKALHSSVANKLE